jgi:hypothetical protein
MKKFNLFLIVAIIASLSISCGDDKKDDVDATKPGVTIQTPSENDEYAIGETILLTATFTDNKELKNCMVSISLVQGNGDGTPWAPSSMTIPLSGTSQSVDNITLFGGPIPICQAGTYKIKFEVSDNATTPNITVKEINIEITSTTPVLSVTKPAEASEYVTGTDFLLLSAICTDNKELKELVYNVTYMDGGKNILKGATGINDPWNPGEAKFDLTGTSKTFTDEPLFGAQIPVSKVGNYKLTLTLTDADGNSTVEEINFILK